MKKLTILVLLAALIAAAHFTKPTEPKKSFTDFLVLKLTQNDNGVVKEKWDELQARTYAESCDYVDHFLYVSVKKNGKTVYRGAFAHWFNTDEIKQDVKQLENKAKTEVQGLENSAGKVQDMANKQMSH